MPVRAIDLFCGGGGGSWGAREAGAEIVLGVDNWKLASEVYAENFPGALAVNENVNGKWLEGAFPAFEDIDLILASPECTNHTCAKGNQPRDESSRRTARHVLRYARLFKARWLILENVVHMRAWSGYDYLLDGLARDYHVRAQILDAADFGVPQTRRRLFLLCDRKRMPNPVRSLDGMVAALWARDILDPTGTWPASALRRKSRAQATIERANRAIAALGRGTPFLIVYYGTDGAGGWQPLDRPLRTLTTLDRFGLVEWDGATPTLRMLQVPELKRAMGWPESFMLGRGTRREKIMLLGNGVCPPVMQAAVSALISSSADMTTSNASLKAADGASTSCREKWAEM